MPLLILLLFGFAILSTASAFQPVPTIRTRTALSAGVKHRLTFNAPPPLRDGKLPPKLIIITGCPGTGKSTFGMSLALEQGILKCISTDTGEFKGSFFICLDLTLMKIQLKFQYMTVRAVMRSYVPESISPPLHRSSYGEP